MEFTPEQRAEIERKLTLKECPICHYQGKFNVSNQPYHLLSIGQDGSARTAMPLLVARCPKCFFTALFNLCDMGVL